MELRRTRVKVLTELIAGNGVVYGSANYGSGTYGATSTDAVPGGKLIVLPLDETASNLT